jgi:hypothetical protein
VAVAGSAHGAELVERERAHAPARTQLAEQNRAALIDEHGERDEREQGHEQEQGEKADAHLDRAAGAKVGALARARGSRGAPRYLTSRHAQHVGQEVGLQPVPGAAMLGEGPHLRRQAISWPGHHQTLRLDALNSELSDDPIQVCWRAENRNVVHAAPARDARIVEDADHAHVGRRRRLDRAHE